MNNLLDFMNRLLYSFQTSNTLFLITPYYSGGDLRYHLTNSNIGEAMARFISAEIAFALNILHANRLVYRDLKPENVMICNDGHVCLIDMGLCKYLKRERAMWSSGGTPSYIAPEVLERKKYSYSADWWSFGVLLWELLTGKPPFMESNRKQLFEQIKNQRLTKPSFMSITISLLVLYE